ncbi:MAG: HNH endonuclease [Spirochaetes bacterium]|nr:HNH endonuclease [Paludibacteraceae bacterium]MBP9044040.1 HNH endonuclease [Spirochaetota bacterium]
MNFIKKIFSKEVLNQNEFKTEKKFKNNDVNNKTSYAEPTNETSNNFIPNIEFTELQKEQLFDFFVKHEEQERDEIYLKKLDDLFAESARLVVKHQQGSTSLIQRKFSIGYNRSVRIIEQLEEAGIVGPFEGSKARQVLIADEHSLEQILNNLNSLTFSRYEIFYERFKEEIEIRKLEYKKQKIEEEERIEKEKIKRKILEKEQKRRLHKEVLNELIESGEVFNEFTNNEGKRESIPQDVMYKVWNRDGGRCARCGSKENLEFDHIIPFSKGGATTYRNIQLLCKKCNIDKSNKIG